MATSKTDVFDDISIQLADFAKALSHPARVAILRTLADNNQCICGEIVANLPLAQSTVSQHLKELKKAGLITGTIDGPRSCYCLNWEALNSMFTMITSLAEDLRSSSHCC